MIGLIILAGFLIFLVGLASTGLSFFNLREEDETVEEKDRWGSTRTVTKKASPKIFRILAGWKKGVALILLAIGLWFYSSTLFYAEPGYVYLIVKPTGAKDAVVSEGYHYKGPFAKVIPWQKHIDIKASAGEMSDEVEGKMAPIGIRFVDQVTAEMSVSTRFELPKDKEQFIAVAVKFRTMENLVENTLKPTIKEQAIQTGYMYSAQDYISGEAQSFRQTFDEQLKGGSYKVRKKTYRDTTFVESIQQKEDREIRDISVRYVVEKVEKNGVPVRIPHEITENGILVSQVIVDQVLPDPDYQKRLAKQKSESAQRQLEQQKIETAKIAQQRIRAEGERDKEAERARQEKEAVATLIKMETKVKEEKSKKELAAIALETEKIEAEKMRVKADAEAYEIKKKVVAGITPETRLKMELEAEVNKAKALANLKLPETYISGGGKGGSSDDALMMLILKELKSGK